MSWETRMNEKIIQKDSCLVVGLDPMPSYFPEALPGGSIPEKIDHFNRMVIDAVADQCVAVKPQSAYYEIYGSQGILALEKTIAYAKQKGLLVILDAKRGDIGSTCEAYAKAYLEEGPLSVDALTVHPYLGRDGLLPFIHQAKAHEKGIFVLVKTSNPSSGDLQDLELPDHQLVYQKIARMLAELDDGQVVGAVVGGTYPQAAQQVRQQLPETCFLVPGYGAQGARGKDLTGFYDAQGFGALISASRSILYPAYGSKEDLTKRSLKDYGYLVREAALQAKQDINAYR